MLDKSPLLGPGRCPPSCNRLQPIRLICFWGFSRQEYWSRLSCSSPWGLPDPGIEPGSPTLQVDFFFFNHLSHQRSLLLWSYIVIIKVPCFPNILQASVMKEVNNIETIKKTVTMKKKKLDLRHSEILLNYQDMLPQYSVLKACDFPEITVLFLLFSCLCDPMDRSPSGSSVDGISQARILE